ncbi:SpaH/EbpB family LPXTG-anchored major pilin [uncultured Gemmiger sp.]|uniref:SpaH/EbpB family LPXTG-anchored major pilin n=1 Tax=uncultured Gemmiger sp. TaxID=1623490 RepID=UPI0025E45310|nr:SpaH/EbpB family LPXTG-anchored major pilin [uncultured Gemmiger sp.]
MKYMKKLMTLLAVLTLALAMAVPAFAEAATTTYTITIKNGTGTYKAYQIFKGDLYNDTLSNIEWGDNVTDEGRTKFGNAADKAKRITTEADAKAFAVEVAKYLTDPAAGTGTDSITGLAAGYYLIKNTSVGEGEVYTDYILQVVKNVEVNPKSGKPTLDKQIRHNDNGEWGVVGDNQIGDTVEFRTLTTVPIVSGYTEYTYVIHDEMSAGLTSNVRSNDDVTIKVNDEDAKVLDKIYYTVTVDPENANKFTVTVDVLNAIKDGKMAEEDTLYTYYTGILNENAAVYDVGKQNNKAYLEYSNNPHDNTAKNETPKKVVYDWTFKMEVDKVDGESKTPLSDAKFVLSKNGNCSLGTIGDDGTPSTTTDLINLIENNDGSYTVAPAGYNGPVVKVMTAGKITIKGLDDATVYYLYETKAPAGYNRLTDAVKFKITATYNETGDHYTSVTAAVNDVDQSSVSVQVANNKGSTLPSTGGIGTTLFYVIGGGLMAVAAVLLVTKKRMNSK